MKIKLFLFVAISFFFINNAFAHKEWVHQYLVWESYEFMKQELGFGYEELGNHIGNGFHGYGDNDDPWATGLVGVGAWREDMEDIVYAVGPPFNGWNPSSTHFWDADCGDNCQTPIPFSSDVPNAWQKAQAYLFGGEDIFFFKRSVIAGTTIQILGRFYKYNSLVEFYNTGVCEYIGYYDVGLNFGNEYGHPVTVVMDIETRKKYVYGILGRIAHLLADVGVPAHAHNDLHPCQHGDEDSYEIWMGGNATGDCEEPHTNFPAKSWSKLTAKSQGSVVDLWGMTDYTAMKYLFYTQNQLADHFRSNDVAGDNNLPQGSNQYLLDRYQILGSPPQNVELSATASECFNYSIRATAALFEWFGRQTNQTKVYLPVINSISFNLPTTTHEIFLGQTGILTCNATNATSYSWQWYACTYDNSCHVPVPGIVLTSLNNKYYIKNNSFNNAMTCSAYENLCGTMNPGGGGMNSIDEIPTALSYYIKVTASNIYGSESKWYTYNNQLQKIKPNGIFPPYGGGCPYVLVHNGENYIYDNNILHRSEFPQNDGLDIQDKYLLKTVPYIDSTDSTISLGLTETNNDYSNFDRIKLVAVDHPENSVLGVTENNDLVLYYPQGVSSAELAENSGQDVTQELGFDSAFSKSVIGGENDSTIADYPQLDFLSLNNSLKQILQNSLNSVFSFFSSRNVFPLDGGGDEIVDSVAVILDPSYNDALPIPSTKADAGTIIAYGSDSDFISEEISFALRQNGSTVIIPIAQNVNIDKVSVNWDSPYEVSYISTTPIFYGGYIENELELVSAEHSTYGDIKNNIQTINQTYSDLDNTSNILLKFKQSQNDVLSGWVRNYVFISDGKYLNPQSDLSRPSIQDENSEALNEYKLYSNYPNPFNPITKIKYDIPKDIFVSIKVFDMLGRQVAELVNEFKSPGRYTVDFNGSNLSSGIYYYKIKAGSFEQTKRMVLIK